MKLKQDGERIIVNRRSKSGANYLRHIAAYKFAAQFVKDKIVLDDGCGSGYGSYYLITNGAEKVIGVDAAEEAVLYARDRYIFENLEFQSCDATQLAFDDRIFDTTISFQVIEHIREMDKFLDEIVRVLKDSGVVLISTPNKRTYSPNTAVPENPFHVKELYLDEFDELLKRHFGKVEMWGVSQSAEAEKFQKAISTSTFKHIGNLIRKIHLSFILKMVPKRLVDFLVNPSGKKIDISDFNVTKTNLENCLDFIAVCRKT